MLLFNMDWQYIQDNSEQILMQGILKLKNKPSIKWSDVFYQSYGNYLICKNEINWYIGEGKNISKRLKRDLKN